MNADDRELEALLRRALHEHAEKVMPAGDGLAKIQRRAANRRRRLVWLRPGMAVAAAMIAVVAAIVIPTVIHRMDNGNSGTQTATRPTAPSTISRSSTAKPGPTAAATRELKRIKMSWPYSSTARAASSGDQALRRPEQLAKTFVTSFTGTDVGPLTAQRPAGALTVTLRRNGMKVSTVQLAKIGKTYVVTGARGTNVQLSTATLAPHSITVRGTFKPDTEATNIWAAAGTPYDTSKANPITDTTSDPGSPWSLKLNPPNGTIATGTKILAAWTVTGSGQLLDFSAIAVK